MSNWRDHIWTAAQKSTVDDGVPPPDAPQPEKPKDKQRFIDAGHLGGLKGGRARAQALSPERRKEIARMGGLARHEKKE